MAHAIIKTGGKQYRVTEGDRLNVEKLDVAEGAETVFEDVLMVTDGSTVKLGDPIVEGAKVTAKVIEQFRDKKVTAFKYKKRTGYHRTKGHRRHLTRLEIQSITG
jgi:large subunit ribosomal protein L21